MIAFKLWRNNWTSNINNLIRFNFSQLYKFQGIGQCEKFSKNQKDIIKIFGQNIMSSFKQAYRSTLVAIVNRDIDQLSQIFVPNLLEERITSEVPKMYLIDQSADEIKASVGKVDLVFGGYYDRQKWSFVIKMHDFQEQEGYQRNFLSIYDNLLSGSVVISDSSISKKDLVKVLLICLIYFQGKIKIIKQDPNEIKKTNKSLYQRIQNRRQLHSMQFEVQCYTPFPFDNKKLYQKDNELSLAIILSQMQKHGYQWRIGDIDNSKQKNMKLGKFFSN